MVGGYSGGNSFCRTYACTNSSSCRIAAALQSPGAIARAIGGFEEDRVVLVDPVLDFGGHGAAVAQYGASLIEGAAGGTFPSLFLPNSLFQKAEYLRVHAVGILPRREAPALLDHRPLCVRQHVGDLIASL